MIGIDRKYPYGIDYQARLRIEKIENYEFVIELWQNIGTNQAGTLGIPENTTIETGQYPNYDPSIDDEDAIVAFADIDGRPTEKATKSANGTYIFINTLNPITGEYALTGIPSSESVIYYFIKLKLKDWNNLAGYNISNIRDINFDNIISGGEFIIDGLKTKKTTNQYITRNGEFMNLFPVCSNRQLRLTSIIMKGSINQTWQAEIHNNGVLIPGATLLMNNDTYKAANFDILIPNDSRIMFFVNGVNIKNPQIICYFKNN